VSAKRKSFIQTQHEFTRYIRDPKVAHVPDNIEERRADIYRYLFINNIDSFLSDNFPVLKQIITADRWQTLVQDFFSFHRCKTPYFAEIPQEFIHFLQTERLQSQQAASDFPFLAELAHYEWVELALSIAEDDEPNQQNLSDPLNLILRTASTTWPLVYQYPVHQISPDFIPEKEPEQPSYLTVYRSVDDDVRFLETNPITHCLLEKLTDNTSKTTLELLRELAADSQHPNPDVIIQGGQDIITDFISRGLILATA